MSEERLHFRGSYRGIFKVSYSGQTHAGVFHQLTLTDLEISDVRKLSSRDVLLERTGDYYYLPTIKPTSVFGFGGVNLSIRKDAQTAFSERIEEVVLQHGAARMEPFSPLRSLPGVRMSNNDVFLEGTVFFSVLKVSEISPPASPEADVSSVFPHPDTPFPGSPIEQHESVFHSSTPPPPTVYTSTLAQNRGCVLPFRRIFFGILFWFLLIKFILFCVGWLSHRSGVRQHEDRRQGKAGSEKVRLDPRQDTLAPMPWNYLYDHQVSWKDFSLRNYLARYTTASKEFEASERNHLTWRNVPVTDELLYFHDLYKDLSAFDKHKLDTLVDYFNLRRRKENLNPLATAEMVVTFVQEIPYVLVHDGSCIQAAMYGGFITDYHLQRKECLPNIVAGVQSPYEFAHNLKGDCDTRSLLAYTLLDRLGITCSVWVSKAYGHSILGLAVPAGSPNYKLVSGLRHYATELTVKGFRAGMLAAEHRNMNNWSVVLNNQ